MYLFMVLEAESLKSGSQHGCVLFRPSLLTESYLLLVSSHGGQRERERERALCGNSRTFKGMKTAANYSGSAFFHPPVKPSICLSVFIGTARSLVSLLRA